MRVLVTGGSGFVGRWTVAALAARGAEVHAVSRKPASGQANASPVAADLLDFERARKVVRNVRPDAVLHLAWDVSHEVFYGSPVNLDWVGASLNLLRASVDAGVSRFVGVGSCSEYAPPGDEECDELTTPIAPSTIYGGAKDAVRRLATAYASQHGVSFAWARLFNLFGAGEDRRRLIPSVSIQLASGRPAPMSSGTAVRDYIDVRDAADALACLTLSRVEGAVNIAGGHGVSIADLGKQLGEIAGRPDLLRQGALPDRAGEPPRLVANTRRLNLEVGYAPPLPLRERLQEAYQSWALSGEPAG